MWPEQGMNTAPEAMKLMRGGAANFDVDPSHQYANMKTPYRFVPSALSGRTCMRKTILAAAAVAAFLSIAIQADRATAMTVASPSALGVADVSAVQQVYWHRNWGWHRHRYWAWRRYHHWGWRHRYWAAPRPWVGVYWGGPCCWHRPWWGWHRYWW
jgi:hypothetical protein